MSYQIEFEERVMLSESQYKAIISDVKKTFRNTKFIFIKNRYFDTPNMDLWNKHQILRLRSDRYGNRVLTYKCKGDSGDTELSESLTFLWQRQILSNSTFRDGEITASLRQNGVIPNTLKHIGTLFTKRMEIRIDNYLLVIDGNTFNNIIDYDLEIEADSKEEAKRIIDMYCKKYNLTYSNDYKSKSTRLFLDLGLIRK